MLHHASLPVADLERSAALYDAALAALGYRRVGSGAGFVGYGVEDGKDALALKQSDAATAAGPGFHLALAAPSRETVHAFHEAAMRHGARDVGAPGPRPLYGPRYYAAFVLDLDGHRIEAVYNAEATADDAAGPGARERGGASALAVAIEPFDVARLEAVVELSLRAWAPVFASIERAMGADVFRAQHPDWRASQRAAVEAACAGDDLPVWLATAGGETVGFVALRLHADDRMGEIHMIAVDPGHQRRGIAAALTRHALAWFARQGMTTVMVETGGDPGHAPARRTYEAAGFRLFPVARYFKKL